MKVLFFENVSLTLRVRNRPMSVLYSPIASDVERSRNIQSRRDLMPVGENLWNAKITKLRVKRKMKE